MRSRHGSRTQLWGEVRVPGASTYRLEVYRGGWRTLVTRPTRGRGFFGWTGTLPRGSKVRLAAGGVTGPMLVVT